MTTQEVQEMLADRPDRVTECDGCHRVAPVWTDPGEPGEFEYCAPCWRKRAGRLKDHDHVEGHDTAHCPQHGAALRKTYTFGRYGDAEVHTYRCGCAVAERLDPVGVLSPAITYHASYGSAAGVAKLHVMQAAVKYR